MVLKGINTISTHSLLIDGIPEGCSVTKGHADVINVGKSSFYCVVVFGVVERRLISGNLVVAVRSRYKLVILQIYFPIRGVMCEGDI
jgi:hypothetical protein